MIQSYSIREDADKLLIVLSPIVRPIIAIGFFITGLLLILNGIAYAFLLSIAPGFYFVIPLAISVIYILAGGNVIKKMTYHEIIELSNSHISITRKYTIGSHTDTYPLNEVTNIAFVGREDFTPHPFEGKYFDMGFGAAEREVQYLISDGNMILTMPDTIRRFGRNVPSWDAEEIIAKIESYTGRRFTPILETGNIDEDEWMNETT